MKLHALALVAALTAAACSTTDEPEVAMMPVSECNAAYWEEQAIMYKEQAETAQNDAAMAREKNQRLQEEYNSCFRK